MRVSLEKRKSATHVPYKCLIQNKDHSPYKRLHLSSRRCLGTNDNWPKHHDRPWRRSHRASSTTAGYAPRRIGRQRAQGCTWGNASRSLVCKIRKVSFKHTIELSEWLSATDRTTLTAFERKTRRTRRRKIVALTHSALWFNEDRYEISTGYKAMWRWNNYADWAVVLCPIISVNLQLVDGKAPLKRVAHFDLKIAVHSQ